MTYPIMFLSDLHLGQSSAIKNQLLCKIIEENCNKTQKIMILGDMFDCWLGDDQIDEWLQPIAKAIDLAKKQNCPTYLMVGNHDFLIGEKLCKFLNCQLISDPFTLKFNHLNILLTHGDLLCTNDHSYQKLRKIIQHPLTKSIFSKTPLTFRQKIASSLKQASNTSNHNYPDKSKPVTQSIIKMIEEYNANYMIHGHTHQILWKIIENQQTKEIYHYAVTSSWTDDSGFFDLLSEDGTLDRYQINQEETILVSKHPYDSSLSTVS